MKKFNSFVDKLSDHLASIATLCLLLAIVSVTWMVAVRNLGGTNFWELEASIYFAVAAVFFASPYTLKTNGHIGMEFLDMVLVPRYRRVLKLISELLGFSVCAYLTVVGVEMTWAAVLSGERQLGLWGPPLWPQLAALPIGMGATALQYVTIINRTLTSGPVVQWSSER